MMETAMEFAITARFVSRPVADNSYCEGNPSRWELFNRKPHQERVSGGVFSCARARRRVCTFGGPVQEVLVGREFGWLRTSLAGLVRNKMFMIIVGGAVGSYF